jgi:hypothetical protein
VRGSARYDVRDVAIADNPFIDDDLPPRTVIRFHYADACAIAASSATAVTTAV